MYRKTILFSFATLFLFQTAYSLTVNASTYGWNATDATTALQSAINSSADTVLVPPMAGDWIVKPIFATSDSQTIIFGKGVVLMAKAGEFHGGTDCLFTIRGRRNVSVVGYGATFRMRKADYQNASLYTASEHRHALSIEALIGQPVVKVSVLGIRCEKSGGDGICVSGISGYPANDPVQPDQILIRDIVCTDNHRQAISMISGTNVAIENCVFELTAGTPPQAGIDWEPDWERLYNCTMTNCMTIDNLVTGIEMYLYRPAWRGPAEISIAHRFCYSEGLSKQGIAVKIGSIFDNGPTTTISFTDCAFRRAGAYNTCDIEDMSSLHSTTTFTRCFFSKQGGGGEPISLQSSKTTADGAAVTTTFGGIAFNDCVLNYDQNTPFITFTDNAGNGLGVRDISGSIAVTNPSGATMSLGSVTRNITLTTTQNLTRPPQVDLTAPTHLLKVSAGSPLAIATTANDPDVGTANGAGIARVIFKVRRGAVLIDSSADASAPFTRTIATTGWERGIYTVWAEAISNDGASVKNIDADAIEITTDQPTAAVGDRPFDNRERPSVKFTRLSDRLRAGTLYDIRGRRVRAMSDHIVGLFIVSEPHADGLNTKRQTAFILER